MSCIHVQQPSTEADEQALIINELAVCARESNQVEKIERLEEDMQSINRYLSRDTSQEVRKILSVSMEGVLQK